MKDEPYPATDSRQLVGALCRYVQALVGYQGAVATRRADPAALAAMGCDPGMPVLAAQLRRRTLAGFRENLLLSLNGAGSIALGLTYILHAFGPTEAEVALWGRVSLWLGLTLLPLTVGFRHSGSRVAKGLVALGWGIVALLQSPPILLWLAFHGSGISDGTPPSAFLAHWAYAIPHAFVLAASAALMRSLLAQPVRGRDPRAGCTAFLMHPTARR